MSATTRLWGIARTAAIATVLAMASITAATPPPAYGKDSAANSDQAPDGSAQISVSVTYESAVSGSDGGGGDGIEPDRNGNRSADVLLSTYNDRQRFCGRIS